MKKKIVRQLYIDAAERLTPYTHYYKRCLIPFEEMLTSIGDALRDEKNDIIDAENAGTITADERQLIFDRLEAFVKKEIKNACKA